MNWTREQRAAIAAILNSRHDCLGCTYDLPARAVTTYAARDIEIAWRAAARERVQRRQRLARQLMIALEGV